MAIKILTEYDFHEENSGDSIISYNFDLNANTKH